MNNIFSILALLSMIGLIIGLIRPSLFRLKVRKHVLVVFSGSFIVFLILFGITTPKTDTPNIAASASDTPQPAISKSEEQLLADVGQNAIKDTGASKVTYKGVEIQKDDTDRPAGSKLVIISFSVSEFFSKSSLIRDTGKISARAFQGVFSENTAIYDVIVWYYSGTADRYGNNKNDVVLTYSMDRVTFGKINWSSFDVSNLCDFLNQEDKLTGRNFNTNCVTLVNIK